jgi:hypothetical protein
VSARTPPNVCADGFLPTRAVKSVRAVKTNVYERPDEKIVRTVNFTVGRPFRHPCLGGGDSCSE